MSGLARVGGLAVDALERRARLPDSGPALPRRTMQVLLFDALDGTRRAMPVGVLDRLEEVARKAVTIEGKRTLVTIRETILPLAGLASPDEAGETLRLLRLTDGSRELAYAVTEALDIRDVDAAVIAAGGAEDEDPIVLIDGIATRIVAPYQLFARHSGSPPRMAQPVCRLPAGDTWIQNFVRPMVEAAGYRVIADDAPEDADLAILAGNVAASPAREVIRLRTEPGETDCTGSEASIYRYDQAALMGALRRHAGRG